MASKAKTKPAVAAKESATTKDFHIEAGEAPAAFTGRTTIPWGLIRPNPNNPRKAFDQEALEELAVSIAQDGLLQNLLVRTAKDDEHQLVAGERRWRAIGVAIAKGLTHQGEVITANWPVPVDVRQLTDEQADFLALLENMARKDLKPLEEARHFRLLIDTHGQTTASIADKTGFTQRFVQQRLQLLELNAGDMERMERGEINIEQARGIVAAYPVLIEVSAGAKVLFLEVAHAIAKVKGSTIYTRIDCDYRYKEPSELLKELNGKVEGFIAWSGGGHAKAGLHWCGRQLLTQLTGFADPNLDAVETALAAARAELQPDAPAPIAGPYLTAWLNKPFSPDPAKAEEERASKERQAQQDEKNKIFRAEQEAKEKARKATAAEALELAPTLWRTAPAEVAKSVTDIFGRLGAPLPWKWVIDDDAGGLFDANGESVSLDEWDAGELLPLVMATVNLAAGRGATITSAVLPEADYIETIRDDLVDEGEEGWAEAEANVLAPRILAVFLAAKGLAYGDPNYRWTADAAHTVADEFISGELKLPDTDAEPELTPAMLALAGVKTSPAAEPAEA